MSLYPLISNTKFSYDGHRNYGDGRTKSRYKVVSQTLVDEIDKHLYVFLYEDLRSPKRIKLFCEKILKELKKKH